MNSEQRPTMLTIEKYVLGELSQKETNSFEQLLAKDAELKNTVEQFKKENQIFSTTHPISTKLLQHKKPARQTAHRSHFTVALASLAFIAMVFAFIPKNQDELALLSPDLEQTRLKGISPQLKIYKKTNTGFQTLKNDSLVSENDILQLAYIPASAKHGLIFSLDGNAQITLHYPYSKTDSTQLNNNGEMRLSFSYELDDAPKFERFYFLTTDSPLNVNQIINKAKKAVEQKQDIQQLLANTSTNLNSLNLVKE